MSITDFDKSREFSAELSPGLIGDAKYRFRLSALCPTQGNLSVETSFADLDVFTDAPPVVKPLFVSSVHSKPARLVCFVTLTLLFPISFERLSHLKVKHLSLNSGSVHSQHMMTCLTILSGTHLVSKF